MPRGEGAREISNDAKNFSLQETQDSLPKVDISPAVPSNNDDEDVITSAGKLGRESSIQNYPIRETGEATPETIAQFNKQLDADINNPANLENLVVKQLAAQAKLAEEQAFFEEQAKKQAADRLAAQTKLATEQKRKQEQESLLQEVRQMIEEMPLTEADASFQPHAKRIAESTAQEDAEVAKYKEKQTRQETKQSSTPESSVIVDPLYTQKAKAVEQIQNFATPEKRARWTKQKQEDVTREQQSRLLRQEQEAGERRIAEVNKQIDAKPQSGIVSLDNFTQSLPPENQHSEIPLQPNRLQGETSFSTEQPGDLRMVDLGNDGNIVDAGSTADLDRQFTTLKAEQQRAAELAKMRKQIENMPMRGTPIAENRTTRQKPDLDKLNFDRNQKITEKQKHIEQNALTDQESRISNELQSIVQNLSQDERNILQLRLEDRQGYFNKGNPESLKTGLQLGEQIISDIQKMKEQKKNAESATRSSEQKARLDRITLANPKTNPGFFKKIGNYFGFGK